MRALRILALALLWIALHLLLTGEAEAGEIVDYYGYEPIDCVARNFGGRTKPCWYPDTLDERLLNGKVVAGSLTTLRIDTSPYDPWAPGDGFRSTQFLLYLYLRFPITPTAFVFGWEVSEITNGDGQPECANSPILPLTVQGGDTFFPIGGEYGWVACINTYHPHQTAFRSDLGSGWVHVAAYIGITPTSRSLVLALPVRGNQHGCDRPSCTTNHVQVPFGIYFAFYTRNVNTFAYLKAYGQGQSPRKCYEDPASCQYLLGMQPALFKASLAPVVSSGTGTILYASSPDVLYAPASGTVSRADRVNNQLWVQTPYGLFQFYNIRIRDGLEISATVRGGCPVGRVANPYQNVPVSVSGSDLASYNLRTILTKDPQCDEQIPLHTRPVITGELGVNTSGVAGWAAVPGDPVFAPISGTVTLVDSNKVVVSSTLALIQLVNVRADASLRGQTVSEGCQIGYVQEGANAIWLQLDRELFPSVGEIFSKTPTGGSCRYGTCQRFVDSDVDSERVYLPGTLRANVPYFTEFRAPIGPYTWTVRLDVEPVGGVAGLEVWSRTAVSFSNIRSRQMLTASIVVSGTEGLIGYAVMDGVGVIYLRPTGTALRVYSLCLAFAGGGGDEEIPPPGMCPAPREAGWTAGGGDVMFTDLGTVRLGDGGWIQKTVTRVLPPDESPPWQEPSGSPGTSGSGVASHEGPAGQEIYGTYPVRVLAKALSGSPKLHLEKKLAEGYWKTLASVNVAGENYYQLVANFDVGQTYLTLRLRAEGGTVAVFEICAEEDTIAPPVPACAGARPYNLPPPSGNLVDQAVQFLPWLASKIWDSAILPAVCRITYLYNAGWYQFMTSVYLPISQILTNIKEAVQERGWQGLIDYLRILLDSIWRTTIRPFLQKALDWLWGILQPVLDWIGVSDYTLKLLQRLFELVFEILRKGFLIVVNGVSAMLRSAWEGFRDAIDQPAVFPDMPPEPVQIGFELVGYALGHMLIIPLTVVYTGLLMWKLFEWTLRTLGWVKS